MEDGYWEEQPNFLVTTFNIFHTILVRIGVRDTPHIWGAGEIRDAGGWWLFGGLGRSDPFVTPHIWGTGEMSTEISATYLGCWGNKYWKSRRIYVALGHDELICNVQFDTYTPLHGTFIIPTRCLPILHSKFACTAFILLLCACSICVMVTVSLHSLHASCVI